MPCRRRRGGDRSRSLLPQASGRTKTYRFLFPFVCSSLFLDYRHRLACTLLGEVTRLLDFCIIDLGFPLEWINRTFHGGPDRELEPLEDPVPELYRPHDGIRTPHGDHVRAQGGEILVGPDLDRLLRADLHAIVALPALLRLLVERLHEVPVQGHEVVRADILAGSLILRLAAVAFFCNHVTRHVITSCLIECIELLSCLFLYIIYKCSSHCDHPDLNPFAVHLPSENVVKSLISPHSPPLEMENPNGGATRRMIASVISA